MKKKELISKALILKRKNNKVYLNYKDLNFNEILKKEVIVKAEYSSINYKDYLICSGKLPVNKNITVPGIDLSGIILKSNSNKFKIGEKVVAIAAPLGIKCNGGYSSLVKINENYLSKMNKDLSTKNIMIFGTAGFTGIYTCLKIKKDYSNKKRLKILVTGATSGVGLTSLIYLNYLGHETCGLISKKNFSQKKKILNKIGTKNIINSDKISHKVNFSLLSEKYDCVIDNLGGEKIDYYLKQIKSNGSLYSIGNVYGNKLNINIMPLILRGVKIIGINAESASKISRRKIFDVIKSLSNKKLNYVFQTLMFKDLKKILTNYKNKRFVGRKLVKFD